MGPEDARAVAGEVSRETDRRAYRRQPRRTKPCSLYNGLGYADPAPLYGGRSPCRLDIRPVPELPRPPALHTGYSRFGLSRQDVDHAPVLRFCLSRGNQRALQISARARWARTVGRIRLA